MSETIKVEIRQIYNIAYTAMKHFGMCDEDAAIMADALSMAEARGIRSHGLTRFSLYFKELRDGAFDVRKDIQILRETPSTVYMDGSRMMGIVSAAKANRIVIEKAKETGVCVGCVTGGSHAGMMAYYTMQANQEGLIGFFATSMAPILAPYGGSKPTLGNMPFCISVPGGKTYYTEPINMDACCGTVAAGKVLIAQKMGQKIPPDWVLDKDGQPTDDPGALAKGGAMVPFGGYKGSGIAVMLGLLTTVLSSSGMGDELPPMPTRDHPDNYGYFILAIDPEKFLPLEDFRAGVDRYAAMIKSCPMAPGVEEVRLPGEQSGRNYQRAMKEGIDYEIALLQETLTQMKEYGILPKCAVLEDMLKL